MKEYGVSEKHEGDEKEKGGEKVKDEKKKKAGGEGALIMAEEREIGGTFHNDSFVCLFSNLHLSCQHKDVLEIFYCCWYRVSIIPSFNFSVFHS